MESYFCRLSAPRATFGQDMTAEEMEMHGDPAIRSGRGFRWDLYPMPLGVRP